MTSLSLFKLRWGVVGAMAVLLLAGPAEALELTASMDKTTYYPGEPMEISVTAHNPEPVDVTLTFPSSCQMYYQIGSYRTPQFCLMVITHATVPAFGSRTWHMQHSWSQFNPGPGMHSLTAGLERYGPAGTVFFEVVVPQVNLQLSLSLNKTRFFVGEAMDIMVTARNLEPIDAVLWFPSACQMYYQMGPYATPGNCATVITSATVPALGSYTWHMQHPWAVYNPGLGTHSVSGGLYGYGAAGSACFEVIESPPLTGSFLVDFDHFPGTDIQLGSVEGLSPYGLHFRTIAGSSPPSLGIWEGNQFLSHGTCTYPTGFNIVADFDMPVYGLTAGIDSCVGCEVTVIARAADGTELDRATATSAPSTAYFNFAGSVSVQSTQPIASAEWWPSHTNAGVSVDNLYLFGSPVRADFNADGFVDQADLDHFQVCHSGPGVQPASACLDARLDDDQDVDQSDFGLLQRCLSGDLPLDLHCAD